MQSRHQANGDILAIERDVDRYETGPAVERHGAGEVSNFQVRQSRERSIVNAPIGSTILLIAFLEIFQQLLGYRISTLVENVVAIAGVVISLLLLAVFSVRASSVERAAEK